MAANATSRGLFSFMGRSGYRFGYLSNRKILCEKSAFCL